MYFLKEKIVDYDPSVLKNYSDDIELYWTKKQL